MSSSEDHVCKRICVIPKNTERDMVTSCDLASYLLTQVLVYNSTSKSTVSISTYIPDSCSELTSRGLPAFGRVVPIVIVCVRVNKSEFAREPIPQGCLS